MTTRRQFLKSGLAATVTTAALSPLVVAAAETNAPNAATGAAAAGSGTLVMVGFGGKRHSSQQGQANSVITTVDLASGHYRQGWLAMPSAHSVLQLATDAYLCLPLDGRLALVVDQEFREIARLACPTGYLFSGHGVVVTSQHRALLSLRRQDARSFADHGCLAVVALPDGPRRAWNRSQSDVPIASMFDSGGVRPHDLALLADGRTVAVSHYGDINYEVAGKTSVNQREPCLVLIDSKDGRLIQRLAAPATGSLTHIAVSRSGRVCGVPLNYYGFDDQGRHAVESQLGTGFEISVAEELESRIAAPMPLYLFDLARGATESLSGEPSKQRRAQSVAYHPAADQFFVAYTFSDSLACVSHSQTKNQVRYISAFELGLSYIRGVCAIGQSDFLAVSGEFRGITLINAKTLAVVRRIDVPLYDSPHLTYLG